MSKEVSKFKSGIQDVKLKFSLAENEMEHINFIASKQVKVMGSRKFGTCKDKMWRGKQCGVFWDLVFEMKKFD